MALDGGGSVESSVRGGASEVDRQSSGRASGPDGARGSDGGGVAIDRAVDGARARAALGSPEARATLSEAAGRIDGGDEPGSAVGAAIGATSASSRPSFEPALGGLQAQPPGAMPPAALTLAQDAAPRAGAGPTPGLPDPEAPFDPTPPPDTFMQRLREGVASDLGRTVGAAQAAAGWVADMVGGAAAAVETGYEAVVTGIEAATGWIGDEHARRQRDDLAARAEGLRAAAEELLSDPEGVARAFAASYEARFEQADALEAAYRSGHADLSAFREAERIRAEAGAELAILGVETAAVAAAGAGAIMKGLRAARLADRLDGPTPLAMAMATAERARIGTEVVEELIAQPGRREPFGAPEVEARISTEVMRRTPGTATGAGQPVGADWIRAAIAEGRGAPIPDRIAEGLEGGEFADFRGFREAFWREVAADPELAGQFNTSNQARMRNGRAPRAPIQEQVGARMGFELDHIQRLRDGGAVYDMDNLRVMTPRAHIERHGHD